MKILLITAIYLLLASVAFGQTISVTSTNLSGTISVTNTFQSIQATTSYRRSCTIQNLGSNMMYVFAGAIASATTSNSALLSAGQSYYCSINNIVLTDQISITGTSGDAYLANFQ